MLRIIRLAVACTVVLAACSPPQPPPSAETTPAAETSNVTISAPAANARVTSPLTVEGAAPGDWYFEAQFPVELVGADGAVLAEAPAWSQSEAMTEAAVAYRAELQFSVSQETPAMLVLQEDMPADNTDPREVRIPLVLLPAS